MPKDINILIAIIAIESLLDTNHLGGITSILSCAKQCHVLSNDVSLESGFTRFRF
jgi:hypothetical protein